MTTLTTFLTITAWALVVMVAAPVALFILVRVATFSYYTARDTYLKHKKERGEHDPNESRT